MFTTAYPVPSNLGLALHISYNLGQAYCNYIFDSVHKPALYAHRNVNSRFTFKRIKKVLKPLMLPIQGCIEDFITSSQKAEISYCYPMMKYSVLNYSGSQIYIISAALSLTGMQNTAVRLTLGH